MTQNEIKAKLKLLASLAEAASILEAEIREDFGEKGDNAFVPGVIENVKNGNVKNIDTAMSFLENYFSDIPKGEPVATPFVDLTNAYFIDAGVRYPSGDELIASLGVSDGTYQVDFVYDAVNSKGDDVVANLALAEIKQGELAEMYGLSKDNMDVDVYTYEDVKRTDFTRKFSVSHDELVGLLEQEQEEEKD